MPSALDEFDGHEMDGLEFCFRVYRLFERIRRAPDGPSRMRIRPSTVEKKLLEELLPICAYVQARYRIGRYISVRWVAGGQSYDAQVYQCGAYVSKNLYPETGYLEVTGAMHRNAHHIRHILDKNGIAYSAEGIRKNEATGEIESHPAVRRNLDFVDAAAKNVLKAITKKAAMTYSEHTTLIVQCTLDTPHFAEEWKRLVELVDAGVPPHSFDEIFIFDPHGQHFHAFGPRPTTEVATTG